MPILNYTTKIAVEKTASQIQAMLARAGAEAVMIEFANVADGSGPRCLTALSFRVQYKGTPVTFCLPAKIEPVQAILHRDNGVPRKLKCHEQAARVAWRIIKDWVEAQLAIIEAEQVEMVEVFLPFAQNPKTGVTVFEELASTDFAMLTHETSPGDRQ